MEVFLRALVMFLILFLLVKFLGKKQIKNLTLYDYVLSITIGSIAADSIISLDTPLYDGIIALVSFSLIGYFTSFISYKNHKVEEIIDGEPIVLYENNNFNYGALDKAKLSIAKVLENCRIKGCFDINDLDCAILEPSGDISILLKDNMKPVTSNDLKSSIKKNSKKETLCNLVIVDGSIDLDELKKSGKTKSWLNKYLKENKLKTTDISLMSIDKNNKVTLYKRC